MTLATAAKAMNGRFTGIDRLFTSVSTDSRNLSADALYVALRGERFDGHDFIEPAIDGGAVGVVVDSEPDMDLPAIVVDDTLIALQQLAQNWRSRFHGPLIAVTGSNGKTTVKEMLGSILSLAAPTLLSSGNQNNHIGVPLSLLKLRDDHQYAVIEMGMNHAGELAVLTRLAAPTVALINNAAAAHLEGLGSIDQVARAKAEIFEGLDDDGIAVVNADDAYADYWKELNAHRKVITFGFGSDADVCAQADIEVEHSLMRIKSRDSELVFTLLMAGRHNAANALAAATVALALDIPLDVIKAGLESFSPVAGRSEVVQLKNGDRLINDSYNANPASMQAAIEMLARFSGRRIMVMGDMAELGPDSNQLHADIGDYARSLAIDEMMAIGPASRHAIDAFGASGRYFDRIDQLSEALLESLSANKDSFAGMTTVLIKGSRSMGMERVSQSLMERLANGGVN
ncbi:MAG: UDP-N-acetylmuramoyl-tripeptide--D-alanyl-D-alanine ligase [marine bacterium B5-7]|nr:MAG: UDP-N-acetylmuramoyl-tripeptide--D-alanyl-D-alanine ligase [marine bacterium B5-7]